MKMGSVEEEVGSWLLIVDRWFPHFCSLFLQQNYLFVTKGQNKNS